MLNENTAETLSQKTKDELIRIAQEHYDADSIKAGLYGEIVNGQFRGCAIGCTNHGLALSRGIKIDWGDHDATARLTGVPAWVWHLADYLFENVEEGRREFARDFPKYLPIDTDFQPILHRFFIWVLTDPEHGSMQYADDAGKAATAQVVSLHKRALAGDKPPTAQEWDAAWDAARAAAGDAAARAQRDEFLRLLKGEVS